jgi:Phosphotransferase enzyme family
MAERDTDRLAVLVQTSLGEAVRDLALVRGGGNNRIYRAELADGPVAVKAYHLVADRSHLQRLERETRSLRWLESCGVGAIPRVRAVDVGESFAVYDWMDGTVLPVPIAIADRACNMRHIGRFLDSLHAAALAPQGGKWPAQEACLSTAELLRQIEGRIEHLLGIAEPALRDFLESELKPVLSRAMRRAELSGLDWNRPLPESAQDFSPSDFGYHNALGNPEGGLSFVDFEYAGWDDAVKLTSDFLWHPAMALSPEERSAYLQAARHRYRDVPGFALRLAVHHPLYGLRWCLILLNEFLPDRWQKRLFAAGGRLSESDWETAKARQLSRAAAYLRAASRIVDTPAAHGPGSPDVESLDLAAWAPAPQGLP